MYYKYLLCPQENVVSVSAFSSERLCIGHNLASKCQDDETRYIWTVTTPVLHQHFLMYIIVQYFLTSFFLIKLVTIQSQLLADVSMRVKVMGQFCASIRIITVLCSIAIINKFQPELWQLYVAIIIFLPELQVFSSHY